MRFFLVMFVLLTNQCWSNGRETKTRRYWAKPYPNGKYEVQYGLNKKSPDDFENFVNSYKAPTSSQEDEYYTDDDDRYGVDGKSDQFLLNQYPEIYKIDLVKQNEKITRPTTTNRVPVHITKKIAPAQTVYRAPTKEPARQSKPNIRNNTLAKQIFAEHTPYSNKAINRNPKKSRTIESFVLPKLNVTKQFVRTNSISGFRTNSYRHLIENPQSSSDSEEVEVEQIPLSDDLVTSVNDVIIETSTPAQTSTTGPTTPNNVTRRRSSSFSYDDQKENGPTNWLFVSHQCADLLQSPIPLTDRGVFIISEYSQKLRISGLSNLPESILVANDGHSAKFSFRFAKGQAPQLKGGPLDVPYIFDQFHFHWGSTNSYGSEHTLNGIRFPLEIHLLFYNSVYNSTAEARDRPKGLAVIAIFYDITSNPEYRPNPFTKYLYEIIMPGMSYTLLDNERFSLKEVAGGSIDFSYLTYRGSLTTPPCSQSVTWIVSTRPKRISNKELIEFRKLRTQDGSMSNNYRPLQDINGRSVFLNVHKVNF